ncbi:hypothetical protein FB451DRAFT_1412795 [Mycena latifolia]|nr:hypothetical protein FB451DRAFT_1412795 [Mycena latifolia]
MWIGRDTAAARRSACSLNLLEAGWGASMEGAGEGAAEERGLRRLGGWREAGASAGTLGVFVCGKPTQLNPSPDTSQRGTSEGVCQERLYGEWNESMLADEDLANDIRLHLQSLGKEITAEKLVNYLNSPEVREEHNIDKPISLTTARRYLDELGYRFKSPKKGQYVDGHERPDVVYYRDNVYLPRLFKLHNRVSVFDNDGNPIHNEFTETGRRVIIWYHDESIFYAHDRRYSTWYHKDSPAKPYQKGEGHSFMVADYFSADFGWLRDPTNPKRNARRCMRPGKGRDGYFTNVEVLEQAAAARALVKELYPDFDHVFVYDNATTHKKRSEGSLSARTMPKGPSGTRKGFEASNFLVEGNLAKEKIKMTGAYFEG